MPTQYEDEKYTTNSTEDEEDPQGATEPGNAYPDYEKTPADDTKDESYDESQDKSYNKSYEDT
jgi:hypothetical protein